MGWSRSSYTRAGLWKRGCSRNSARPTKPASTEQLAQGVGEGVSLVAAALHALVAHGSVVAAAEGRWLSDTLWGDARERILRAVREYAEKFPARYGMLKGELKSGLKASLDGGCSTWRSRRWIQTARSSCAAERVRPGGTPWEPPAATMAVLEKLEGLLEKDGFQVPENDAWAKALGSSAADAAGLGHFLARLVRVNAELTYTATQMSKLEALLAGWFAAGNSALTVADFRNLTGASRKFSVPLLEHCDRMGWTVRVGDERRKG